MNKEHLTDQTCLWPILISICANITCALKKYAGTGTRNLQTLSPHEQQSPTLLTDLQGDMSNRVEYSLHLHSDIELGHRTQERH